MSDVLTSKNGGLFIQFTPGKAPLPVDCTDLEDLSVPQGDVTLIQGRAPDGSYTPIGSTIAPPGTASTSLKMKVKPEQSVLDQLTGCPFTLYALLHTCGMANVFGNWVRANIVHHSKMTSRDWAGLMKIDADEAVVLTVPVQAWGGYEARLVQVGRMSISETRDINDIEFYNPAICAGDCGPTKGLGTEGFAISDGTSGSPIADADVWGTIDAGVNWSLLTGGVFTPFSGGNHAMAAVAFQLDRTRYRWLLARGADAANPMQIAYSDDLGYTWTRVTVGSTNNEGAQGAGALFCLDKDHLYLVTTLGRLYFSSDQGITWTQQTGVYTLSGGTQLNVVKFTDINNGWIGGNSDKLFKTNDGGDSWQSVTSPTSADNITSLHAFSKYRLILGSNADECWQSWDAGSTWESKNYPGKGTTGTLRDIAFVNEQCGYMLQNTSGNVGTVLRTIDGGHNWEALVTPPNLGLNAIKALDVNLAFVAGNAQGGSGVILKVSE